MRIALLGAGRIGRLHARLLKATPGVDTVVVGDVDAERAADVAQTVGIEAAPSIDAALDGAGAVAIAAATAIIDCEAAVIDGASRIGIFWRIALPLSVPGLVTVGVLAFVGSWNAYLLPLLLLQGEMRTLPLGVADYSTEYSADTAGVLAFTSIAMIPALVLFLTMQGRIVNGLQGAVKG